MVQVIDETAADLKALVERDFGPIGSIVEDRVLLDWLHYRARLIPQRQRTVLVSLQVHAKLEKYPAIRLICREMERAGDVTPWLSDHVRKRKADPKADLMFNDWQISHFHLGNVFVRPGKVARDKPLLFAYVASDSAAFLDVQPHGAWAMRDLLRVLHSVSPASMPEFKGILGTERELTDAEIDPAAQRRKRGY